MTRSDSTLGDERLRIGSNYLKPNITCMGVLVVDWKSVVRPKRGCESRRNVTDFSCESRAQARFLSASNLSWAACQASRTTQPNECRSWLATPTVQFSLNCGEQTPLP